MKLMGYAACNLVIGVGGILRNHSRDTLGFALKATYVEVNGVPREIDKDPVTDRVKKSHKGLMILVKNGKYFETIDKQQSDEGTYLQTVWRDGNLLIDQKFEEIKERVK